MKNFITSKFVNTGARISFAELADFSTVLQVIHGDSKIQFGLKPDNSHIEHKGFRSLKLISPILKNEGDRQLFSEVVNFLKQDLGFLALPGEKDVHIEVSAAHLQGEELAVLLSLWSKIENQALKYFEVSKERRKYLKPVPQASLKFINENASKGRIFTPSLRELQDGKDFGLNLLRTTGSVIELKIFNSTTNTATLDFYRRFAEALVFNLRSQNPQFVQFLIDNENSREISFTDLLRVLGFDPTVEKQKIEKPPVKGWFSTIFGL